MEKLVLKRPFKSSYFSNALALMLPFALALTSCSGGGLETVHGIDDNTLVTGFLSQKDNAKLIGTGRVRFTSVLPTASSRSLALRTSLDNTLGNSSLSVAFYSSDLTVPSSNGTVITFTRSGASVTVSISINGTTRDVNASKLAFYFPAALDLIIDVHNVNSQARVLIWRRDRIGYTADTADVDSERVGDLLSSLPVATGAGGFTGLILTNATVSGATISSAKLLD